MKKLILSQPKYRLQLAAFRQFLQAQGYADSTCYNMPHCIKEFLYWLERQNINQVEMIKPDMVLTYFKQLSERKNQRRAGGLSPAHLEKHRQALRLWSKYLLAHHQILLPIRLPQQKIVAKIPSILSLQEIKILFELKVEHPFLHIRDRAMLEIYYSCALRRSEGVALNIDDFFLNQKLLLVRKSKTGQQRFVPLTQKSIQNIQLYLHHRAQYMSINPREKAFFLSYRGQRLQGGSLFFRLQKLAEQAGIDKKVGLHSLRHSMATHLLEQGMKLKDIQKILGHRSLESTQLYTHIIKNHGSI